MPYIASESVATIRKAIRKEFPNAKFSVTRRHHSSLYVTLLSSEYAAETFNYKAGYIFNQPIYGGEWLKNGNRSVNHYNIEGQFSSEVAVNMFTRILQIINSVAKYGTESVDSDYGNIPTFYINLHVGQWDKPYKQVV